MTQTIFIETTVLNSFLGEESDVYIKIGDHFVRKKGRDLQEGDKLVVKTESIDKDPEEVYAVLDHQSVRYRVAKNALFESNNKGRAIPRLRTLLWRGMADPKIQGLEAKVLLENDDFAQGEYRDVADVLNDIVSVTRGTVQTWLKGEVIAPEDWENFKALSSIGENEGTELATIYCSKDQNVGFHAAYQLYVGLRSTIMSYLAKRTGEERSRNKGNAGQRNASQKGKYTPEIEAVVRMFIDEIDHHYVAARVTKIKSIEKGSENSTEKEQPDPNLSKGIVTTKPIKGILLPMQMMRDIHVVLENAFYDVLNKYIKEKKNAIFSTANPLENFFVFNGFQTYSSMQLLPYDRTRSYAHEITVKTCVNEGHQFHKKEAEQRVKDQYQYFMEDLAAGKIDEHCNLKQGTIAKMIDTMNQYEHALPKSYYEIRALSLDFNLNSIKMKVNNKDRRITRRNAEREMVRLERRVGALEKYVAKEYGLHNNKWMFIRYHESRAIVENPPLDYGYVATTDSISLGRSKQRYEREGFHFFTRDETLFLLACAGCQELINVYDKNNF